MQQRTPNSAPHVLLQRRYNFGPFEPHLYLQCTAPHPPQAQPDPPQGQTEVVSVIPNTDPHSPKGSALRPRLIGPANQFFSKQGKGWEKNIVYKIHLITYIFYCDRKRTCNSAELEKFKRWGKEHAKQALETREVRLHSITKNHCMPKPCSPCSGRRTQRFFTPLKTDARSVTAVTFVGFTASPP